jgi:hypothetical protein
MKRAVLLVSPHLILDLFKVGPARAFEVINFALPEDARFVDVRYINSEQHIALEVESESFPEMPPKAKQPVTLSSPECRIVPVCTFESDEQVVDTRTEVPRAPEPSEVSE